MNRAEHLLVDALVGQHVGLYYESAEFHAGIETLARMLPAMVDGLAATAAEGQADYRARLRAIEQAPSPTFPYVMP